MSRAFAIGFAASAALHAAVLAALWHGPSGGGLMEHDTASGVALVWTDPFGTIGGTPSPDAARDEPVPTQSEENIPGMMEGRPSFDAAAIPPSPALASLPLPPPLPPSPRSFRQASMRPTPGPTPAAGAAGEGEGGGRSEGQDAPGAAIGEGGILLPARIHTKHDPVYPLEARRNRWQGTVLLAVTVSPEGHPIAVDVARSSGHLVLDEAAADAVRQWRFVSARRNGVAVEDRVAVPITFRLRD